MPGIYEENFKQAVKSYRRNLIPLQKKASIKTIQNLKWLYPFSSEKKYQSLIYNNFKKPLSNETNRTIELNYNRWLNEKQRFDSQNLKIDDWMDEVEELTNRLNNSEQESLGEDDSNFLTELGVIAGLILTFNRKQWFKFTKKATGFNYTTDESWWGPTKKAWQKENISLIKNLSDGYINNISETVYRGIRNGLSQKEITKQLRKKKGSFFGPRYKVNKKTGKKTRVLSRGEIIVRDQVGKLNGQITKHRMTETGINTYEWLTSNDERVRGKPGGKYPKAIPSHWDNHHRLGRWADASLFAFKNNINTKGNLIWNSKTRNMPMVHPGEAILCRCTAIAYMADLLESLDKELIIEERKK